MAVVSSQLASEAVKPMVLHPEDGERSWYAIYTLARNERSVARYLDQFQIETFVPTFESERRWKNRQTVRIAEVLFPTYVFARLHRGEYGVVLRAPGARQIVGNPKGPVALPGAEIEFLRSEAWREKIEPYRELAVGQRVRIRNGFLEGLEGVLVRKKNGLRFVITLELIQQNAAVEVSAADLEPVVA